jgi:hypothetical protein
MAVLRRAVARPKKFLGSSVKKNPLSVNLSSRVAHDMTDRSAVN